ncbi:MAG: molecular chaperone DnaJ, partial [Sphingobium sp.]
MGFLSLALVIAAAWLVFTGRIQRLTGKDGVMLGLAIVGAVAAARGQVLIGGLPLLLSTLYAVRRLWPRRRRRPAPSPAPARPAEAAALRDARALLGVDERADEPTIRAAHRRLNARNHPDAGGTQALAER